MGRFGNGKVPSDILGIRHSISISNQQSLSRSYINLYIYILYYPMRAK